MADWYMAVDGYSRADFHPGIDFSSEGVFRITIHKFLLPLVIGSAALGTAQAATAEQMAAGIVFMLLFGIGYLLPLPYGLFLALYAILFKKTFEEYPKTLQYLTTAVLIQTAVFLFLIVFREQLRQFGFDYLLNIVYLLPVLAAFLAIWLVVVLVKLGKKRAVLVIIPITLPVTLILLFRVWS